MAEVACGKDFTSHFDDHDDCIEQCLKVDGGTGEAAATYTVAAAKKSGNTVQCRALEVSRALDPTDPQRAEHCAAVFGEAAPCIASDP